MTSLSHAALWQFVCDYAGVPREALETPQAMARLYHLSAMVTGWDLRPYEFVANRIWAGQPWAWLPGPDWGDVCARLREADLQVADVERYGSVALAMRATRVEGL